MPTKKRNIPANKAKPDTTVLLEPDSLLRWPEPFPDKVLHVLVPEGIYRATVKGVWHQSHRLWKRKNRPASHFDLCLNFEITGPDGRGILLHWSAPEFEMHWDMTPKTGSKFEVRIQHLPDPEQLGMEASIQDVHPNPIEASAALGAKSLGNRE